MKQRYWLASAAGALAIGLASGAQAAPPNASRSDLRAAAEEASAVQTVNWGYRRRYYDGHYYHPRRNYREYGYGNYYRPYGYYGYSPGFGYYDSPRYYHRWWW
jgi:hypothetical protein